MFQELYFLREILLFRGQVMSDSGTPWSVAHQGLLSMAFPRQEYWSRLPFRSPGDLPDPRIKPVSPLLQAGSLPTKSPNIHLSIYLYTHTHTHAPFSKTINPFPQIFNLYSSSFKITKEFIWTTEGPNGM